MNPFMQDGYLTPTASLNMLPIADGVTAKDLCAARAARIPFLYASWGFGDLKDQPCTCTFSELPEAVSRLLEG